jgi:hypothetical protein
MYGFIIMNGCYTYCDICEYGAGPWGCQNTVKRMGDFIRAECAVTAADFVSESAVNE